ncbi:MAG: hypothetical protein R8J85_02530 [Mariprofundales bacterium]
MCKLPWLIALIMLLGSSSSVIAAETGRFTVTIPLTKESDWKKQVDRGLSLVLDRVLLQSERHDARLKGARYLVRATPHKDAVQFQFRASAVIAALQRRGLHPISLAPRIRLHLSMHGMMGSPMPQTVAQLQQEADSIATHWGILWDNSNIDRDDTMTLKLQWQWVDDHWLSLTVDANDPSLVALGGENRVDTEQPMVALRDRLYRIILRARDIAATQQLAQHTTAPPPITTTPEYRMIIAITRSATLSEQVGLEQVLQAVPAVKRVTPLMLGSQAQRYQLLVTDDLWVATWFASRGMEATVTADGWKVQ